MSKFYESTKKSEHQYEFKVPQTYSNRRCIIVNERILVLGPCPTFTNLNKKCAELGILILLHGSWWLLKQLPGTSWYFLTILNRLGKTKMFANMLKKNRDYLACLVTSWWRLGFSWRCLSRFLMACWCLLDVFLMSSWCLLDDFLMIQKQHEIVKKQWERFKRPSRTLVFQAW